ncbi:MAG: LysE family translocator [Silicimonas sp.]|nr:LysE family translocator [Silicimonas sp.]
MIAEWLPHLLAGWGVQLIGVLSPGPGVALILGVATTRGRSASILTCAGIAAGSTVLALGTILGLGLLLSEVAWAMTAVKIAGAAYMAWLASKAFKRAFKPDTPLIGTTQAGTRSALAGFAMQITNPKAIVYWLAAIALAGLSTAPWPIIALFLVGSTSNSFFGHGIWAIALSSRPFLTLYQRARRSVDAVLGAFFAFVAFKLATSET